MRLSDGSHLTYCTNIHAGEAWSEVRAALGLHLPEVKRGVSPEGPFGVGLRLSSQAANGLRDPPALEDFQGFLAEQDLYVFTINGFPYGTFHGQPVKERVYTPDWRQEERREYTLRLAGLLARLLPGEEVGTISTVPIGWKPDFASGDIEAAAEALRGVALDLHRLQDESGRTIMLTLEPEPGCVLETVAETIEFFEKQVFRPARGDGEEDVLRRHLGVCLDACHAAVEFEDPTDVVQKFRSAGIGIGKMQISAGLKIEECDDASREALLRFDDRVYLHQVVVRTPGGLRRFPDLPQALADEQASGMEWRVHFHVPVWSERLGVFASTQDFLRRLLDEQRQRPFTVHLEVETYTWEVLPHEHRGANVDEDIARELLWVMDALR